MNAPFWIAIGLWALSCVGILRFFAVAASHDPEPELYQLNAGRRHLSLVRSSRIAS